MEPDRDRYLRIADHHMREALGSLARIDNAMADLSATLAVFNGAAERATEQWPEVVLEDILDAEYLGEE